MNDKLLVALIAAASAGIGGLITAVLGPWVKHRLDLKTAETDRKRQLIAEWRSMVSAIANETSDPDKARSLLQGNSVFLSLEPHLSDDARRNAYARSFTVASGVEVPYPLHAIKLDITRIEKSWGLAN
jgi:hypothetical protein